MKRRNGEITGYVIILYDMPENISHSIPIYNQSQLVYVKEYLKKYHNYSIQIAAKTSVGLGKYSSWIKTKTLEDSKEKLSCVEVVVGVGTAELKMLLLLFMFEMFLLLLFFWVN